MCRMASFLYRVNQQTCNIEFGVHDLESHSDTQSALGLKETEGWFEGHYTPEGEVQLRTPTGSNKTAEKILKTEHPTFDAFIWYLFTSVNLPYTNNEAIRSVLRAHNVAFIDS